MNAQGGKFGPLAGLKILDIATILAGPFAATLMADMGAEVVKLEIPGSGDGLRGFPPFKEGKSLWWKAANRGKQYGTLDLRAPEGVEIFKKMLPEFDVLIENFRPGTLARWGLDRETLWEANPKLVVLRATAFGQTGPYSNRPGFARVFEAMGGLTHITGEAESAPMHAGFPLADSIGGLFGAMSVLAALYRVKQDDTCLGEEIDLSLTEATFRLLDFLPIEYDQLGVVRGRSGNRNQYSAPSDVYMTADKKYVSLAGSTNAKFRSNSAAIGRPELIEEPRFATNEQRVRNADELDRIFGSFVASKTLDEVLDLFEKAQGTIAPIYAIDQIFEDPHYMARECVVPISDEDFETVRVQNVVPKFTNRPGRARWSAKSLGADNKEIFARYLDLPEEEIDKLAQRKIV